MVKLKGLLLLSTETLSHFEYHWFWGLRFKPSIIREGNLAVQVRKLAQDEVLLELLQEQQRTVLERDVLIQLIYRFFNIKDFAFNTYRLAAYESNKEFMQLAQGKETMLSNYVNITKQAAAHNLQWGMNAMHRLLQSCNFPLTYLSEAREERALVAVGISQSQPPELPDAGTGRRFIVKANMQPHLLQLEINRCEGDILYWRDIRHAFRAKVLQAHPDKNGTAERFRTIKNALDRLEQQIFCAEIENQQKNHTSWQDFFYETYKEFDRIMTRVETGIVDLNIGITALNTLLAETQKEIAELNTGIAETKKGIAELNETYDELENNLNKLIRRQKKVNMRALEYARQNDIFLPDKLLSGHSFPSKVFSNQNAPSFFGRQPEERSQAELSYLNIA